MLLAEDVLIISDLHMAAERDRGLFQADKQLAEFLQWVHESTRNCHVLLNGDVLDFLVDKKEASIDLDDAADQAIAIAEKHQEVFKALQLIANSNEHELFILGGNHDPELALPSVQRKIETVLVPNCNHSPVRWFTNGEAALLQVGVANVLVEHGDQYDSWNWIDHEALRRIVCLASRNIKYQGVYSAPPGSQLVINRFNPIRDKFHWLNTLQPFNPSILPLALEVVLPSLSSTERDQIISAAREFRDFSQRSLTDTILSGFDSDSVYWANEDDERQLFSEWLSQYETEENVWGVASDLKAALARAIARLRTLTARATLKHISRRDSFFKLDDHDGQAKRVTKLVGKGANLVVHGHTHSAKAYTLASGLYLNTGTWGQLTKLPESTASPEVWASFVESLRLNRAASFLRATFARIRKQEKGTTAELCEWADGHAKPQSVWCFENQQWRKVA